MIFDAAFFAFKRLFTAPFRSMLWKSLAISLIFLAFLWFFLRQSFILYLWPSMESFLPGLPAWLGWLGIVAFFILSLSLALLLAFFIAPITAFIGSFFIDEAVAIIEREDYPDDLQGTPLPLGRSIILSLRFLGISLIGNICAILLFFFPAIHLFAFYLINAYLLGKEYFILNALRFHEEKEAKCLYRLHRNTVLGAGLCIAFFVSIPVLNLLTPLFAAAMMSYVYKAVDTQRILKVPQKKDYHKNDLR